MTPSGVIDYMHRRRGQILRISVFLVTILLFLVTTLLFLVTVLSFNNSDTAAKHFCLRFQLSAPLIQSR